jgi:putative membrane protein
VKPNLPEGQAMIRNFSDHAANERTFLAWIRTAIAVMAFGFLVARFNLFLDIAAQSLGRAAQSVRMPGVGFGGIAGIALIVAGTVMVAVAAFRFVRTGRAIDSPEPVASGARIDLALAILLVVLGVALVLYLSHTLLTGL